MRDECYDNKEDASAAESAGDYDPQDDSTSDVTRRAESIGQVGTIHYNQLW